MIVTRAPLRISLGGGGTDLASYYSRFGGFILSAAINKYVYIALNRPSVDDLIRIKYSKSETVECVDQIEHPLVRETLRLTGVNNQVEISSMADVPAGTGLGSSGSFLVSLLAALHTLKRENISTQELAEEACKIEIDIVGQPVGKHDQYLAAFGGITCLKIDCSGKVTVYPLAISDHNANELRNNTLLFYTGIRRIEHGILSQQNSDTNKGKEEVINSLHTTKEIGMEIKEALEEGDLELFGTLLDRHWQVKKARSKEVSGSKIDLWYEMGKANGALGGKVIGAGGAGFLMLYCPKEHQRDLRKAMSNEGLRETGYEFDMQGAKVMVNF